MWITSTSLQLKASHHRLHNSGSLQSSLLLCGIHNPISMFEWGLFICFDAHSLGFWMVKCKWGACWSIMWVSQPLYLPNVYTGAHCAGPEEVTCLHHTFYYESTCTWWLLLGEMEETGLGSCWLCQTLWSTPLTLIQMHQIKESAGKILQQMTSFVCICSLAEALWGRVARSLLFTTLPLPKLDEIKMNRNKEHSQGCDRHFIGPTDL